MSILSNHEAAALLARSLADLGVREVCISPGSRSAPLAVAVSRETRLKVHVVLDERAAAFFALGRILRTCRPVAVVCTSGTAAVNQAPAVAEAFHARLPLLVLTGDRPPESRDNGSPQTLDQRGIFGSHLRWFHEMAVPGEAGATAPYVASVISRAVGRATGLPAGPVHVNIPLREPLAPGRKELEGMEIPWGRAPRSHRRRRGAPLVEASWLAEEVQRHPRGVIICGPSRPEPGLARAVARFSERSGYPVLADAASPARRSVEFPHHDLYLRAPEFLAPEAAPQRVIRIGAWPTSKPLLNWLKAHPHGEHIVLDETGEWRDPFFLAEKILIGDPISLLQGAASRMEPVSDPGWSSLFSVASRAVIELCQPGGEGPSSTATSLSGPVIARVLDEFLRSASPKPTLFCASSMAIRDLDSWLGVQKGAVTILSNRGVNGIDGTLSTAAGVASSGGRVLALVGDLAFLHDLSGLLLMQKDGTQLDLVVMDDGGGTIFHYLPIAQSGDVDFDRLFYTPHHQNLSAIASGFGLPCVGVDSPAGFARALDSPPPGGSRMIHLRVHRQETVDAHRKFAAMAVEAVGQRLMEEGLVNRRWTSPASPRDKEEESHSWVERKWSFPSGLVLGGKEGTGDGTTAVLLHGFAGSERHWEPVLGAQEWEGTHFLLPDLPGHGESVGAVGEESMSLPQLLDDLVALAGEGRAVWGGYSLGGRLALQVAVRHPQKVEALVLVSSSPGIEGKEARRARRERDEAWAQLALSMPPAEFLTAWKSQTLFSSLRRGSEEVRRRDDFGRTGVTPSGLATSLRLLGAGTLPPLWDHLPHLSMPVLLVVGGEDPVYLDITAHMARQIPNCRRVVLPGVGHALPVEAPEPLSLALRSFLSSLS